MSDVERFDYCYGCGRGATISASGSCAACGDVIFTVWDEGDLVLLDALLGRGEAPEGRDLDALPGMPDNLADLAEHVRRQLHEDGWDAVLLDAIRAQPEPWPVVLQAVLTVIQERDAGSRMDRIFDLVNDPATGRGFTASQILEAMVDVVITASRDPRDKGRMRRAVLKQWNNVGAGWLGVLRAASRLRDEFGIPAVPGGKTP